MVLFRHQPTWQLSEAQVTAESLYWNRRRVIKALLGAGVGIAAAPLASCQARRANALTLEETLQTPELKGFKLNPQFEKVDRPVTAQALAGQYNNYYEFGGSKNIWPAAQALPTQAWQVEVTGLVQNPQTYDLDDFKRKFELEERIYRFRCVEAWSMVMPWIGFPMRSLLADVQPTSEARFVRFTSYYDPEVTPGPGAFSGFYPWPYTEGLSLAEMQNELAFLAIGIYGRELPKQQGAPIRAVLPWKYGFKGAKSIVKIEFVAQQPATFWNVLQPNEYKFEANVEPDVPHPRWSQARERFIGTGPNLSWTERPTLLYNGYAEYVADLYT